MDRQWIARRYQPGDEVQILQLRRLVFGDRDKRRNMEGYWRWEFLDNPAGQATIWLAEDEGRLVGQYAVRPARMHCCGEVILGSLALDAMTHPDFRRQAVFPTLGHRTYEELEGEGILVTYMFPKKESMLGSIAKFHWIYMRSLPVFVRPLIVSKMVEILDAHQTLAFPVRSLSKALTRLRHWPGNAFPEEGGAIKWIDIFWEAVAPKYRIAVVRDSTFLNWRYFDNPGREYRALIAERGEEIVAYMILRCMEQFGLRGGMIVDLGALLDREAVLSVLLGEAERFFMQKHMDLIACLINGDDKYVGVLKKHHFLPLPRKAGFKEWYFGCRLNSPILDEELFTDPANWLLTFGDTDVI